MKKAIFLIIFAVLAVSSLLKAETITNRQLFVEGNAGRTDHLEFFFLNFRKEAVGAGFTLAERRANAGFIFQFEVTNNPDINVDGNQFALKISLINNANNEEILFFYFYFNNLDEMYEHTRYLFLKAVEIIPPLTEDAVLQADSAWKNKWFYLRASFDYPIRFFRLQPAGLIGGIAVYDGPFDAPTRVSDLDHKIIVLPGFTIGAEFQFLDFMSLELNLKGDLGDFDTNYFFNLSVGAQLKFSIKHFRLFNIQPYLAGLYPVTVSNVFSSYPRFFFGGGLQFSIKGGKSGAFFIDVNYMHAVSNAVRKNPYKSLFPNPSGIYYRPFNIGIGVGYKFGFRARPVKQPDSPYRYIEIPIVPSSAAPAVEAAMPEPAAQPAPEPEPLPEAAQEPEPEPVYIVPPAPAERERAPRTRTFYF